MSAGQQPHRKIFFVRAIVLLAVLAGFLVGATPAPADVTADSGEAFGMQITVGGILTFGKFPDAVLQSTGGSATASAASFSATLGALGTIGFTGEGQVASQSTTGTTGAGGSVTSTSNLLNLSALATIPPTGLGFGLSADAITSTCTVSETSTSGSTTITNGSVTLGAATTTFSGTWDASAGPQTILNVANVVSLVLNEQSVGVSASHRERTVTAIHLILLPGTVGAVDVVIGQVHCDVDGSILAATFSGANATRTKHGVLVRWATASEADTLGFNVYRQVRGRRVRVNHRLIPAALSVGGHRYSLLDRKAPARRAVRYWIQSVDRDGTRTWYGPTRPVPAS